MAKKWNRRRNNGNNYLFPYQEPWCERDEKFIKYERVLNQCLTRGYGGSICEHFCLKDIGTSKTFELRQFYKEMYAQKGKNGGNGNKKQTSYCSHHDYDIRRKKVIKKCLTCGPHKTICHHFYIKDRKTDNLINPRIFYEEEFIL